MERVLALVLVFAVISSSYGLTETFEGKSGTVTVENGQVGIGKITGGSFGPRSFSIAGPGGVSHGLPANALQHGGPIIINPPPKNGVQHQDNLPNLTGGIFWEADQYNQVKPQRAQANSEHREFTQISTNGGSGDQEGNFQGSQGASLYPGLGGYGGQGGGFQGGQGATFYPGEGGQGGQGVGFQGGQGGGFQAGQEATFSPGKIVRGHQGGRFQNGQEATSLPGQVGQGGSIQIGSITGGTFGKDPNLVNHSRNPNGHIPNTGVNTGHSNVVKSQVIHGYNGNYHEEVSDESSYSAESAEEPEAWVWTRK